MPNNKILQKMKTISTLLFSIITLVATANNSIEITNTTVASKTSLTATTENTVTLNWVAKNESNSTRYEIERSFYSNNFTVIASTNVPFSNNSVKNYRINDNAAELSGREVAYYRVKQVAANGTVTYSNTMVVNLNNNNASVKSNSAISFNAAQNGNVVIKVKTIAGQVAATVNSIAVKGNNTVELNNVNGLAKGIYTVEVSVNGVAVENQKIIVE